MTFGAASLTGEFDASAASSCYVVRAKPLAGGAVVELIEACVDNTLTDLGLSERTPDDVERWLATCEMPMQADPSADADNHVSDRSVAPREPETRAVDGCRLATGAPASPLVAALWSLATLLCLGSRRRRGS